MAADPVDMDGVIIEERAPLFEAEDDAEPAEKQKRWMRDYLIGGAILEPGENYAIVSAAWWRKWCVWADYMDAKQVDFIVAGGYDTGGRPAPPPGPIDCEDIIDDPERGILRHDMKENTDYVVMAEKVYSRMQAWHGAYQVPIMRPFLQIQIAQRYTIVLHPITLTVKYMEGTTETETFDYVTAEDAKAVAVFHLIAQAVTQPRQKLHFYREGPDSHEDINDTARDAKMFEAGVVDGSVVIVRRIPSTVGSSADTWNNSNARVFKNKPGHAYVCNHCWKFPLTGQRFRCRTCPDYDLCIECSTRRVHHASHRLQPVDLDNTT